MDYTKMLENIEFRNWIKSALGLKFTQQGMTSFIEKTTKSIHNDILKIIGNTCNVNCGVCSIQNILQCGSSGLCKKTKQGSCWFHIDSALQPRPCPNNVCDKIQKEIRMRHRYPSSVQWANTDATKWSSDYWELAKCYLPNGYAETQNETKSDLTGLLTLIINCKDVDKYLTAKVNPGKNDLYHKVKDIRHKIVHTGSLQLSESDMHEYLDMMVNLLRSYESPISKGTDEAIDNIHKLRNDNLRITNSDIQEVIATTKVTQAFQEIMEKKEQEMEIRMEQMIRRAEESRINETLSHIPKNTQVNFNNKIQSWQNQEARYTDTRASKVVVDSIHEFNCIAVTGASGAGKSSIIHHAALQLQKEGYEVIPCRHDGTHDLIEFYNSKIKQVFVVDDWCGKATINHNHVTEWRHVCDDISKQINKKCKLLISCRLNIIHDPQLSEVSVQIIEQEHNICSDDLKLDKIEKCDMFSHYVGEQLDNYKMETDYEYFPLLCNLAAEKNPKGDEIVTFFKQPLQCIYNDLNSFKIKDITEYGNNKMCVVCLVVMFQNLDIKWLDNIHNENSMVDVDDQIKLGKYPGNPKNVGDVSRCVRLVIQKVCHECRINLSSEAERRSLKTCFLLLEGTYLTRTGDTFSFLHDRIYDIAARVSGEYIPECLIELSTDEFVGNRFIFKNKHYDSNEQSYFNTFINVEKSQEEKYFHRLVNDLHSRSNTSFMINHQLSDSYYRGQFKCFIDCHQNEIKQLMANSSIMEYWSLRSWVTYGYVELLESLVVIGLECLLINNENENQANSLIRLAINNHNSDMLKILFKHANLTSLSITEYIEQTSAFHCLCKNKKVTIEEIELLFKHNADPNQCDKREEKTPFHHICKNDKVTIEMIELFFKHHADPNQCDYYRKPPFQYICKNDKVTVEMIELLFKHHADPNQCDYYRKPPFQYICKNDKVTIEVIELFFKHNADPNQCDNTKSTPFHCICKNNNVTIQMIELFFKHNADPNKCDTFKDTPFHYICKEDKVTFEMIELFFKHNANPNQCDNEKEKTTFHFICKNNNVTIELFFKHNADPNKCDTFKDTPFHYICENNNVTFEMIKLFFKHNADPNQCDKREEKTAFHYICKNDKVTIEMIELFFKHNADPNKCDTWERKTPFHCLCKNNNVTIEMTELFFKHNANPNQYDNEKEKNSFYCMPIWRSDNVTPFHCICKNNNVTIEIIELFFKHNADPNKCDNLKTPFHCICENYNVTIEIIELFFKHNADPNQCVEWKIKTPFHCICENNNVTFEMIELFFKHNADSNQCDIWGKTPFNFLCENDNKTSKMSKLFLKDTEDN